MLTIIVKSFNKTLAINEQCSYCVYSVCTYAHTLRKASSFTTHYIKGFTHTHTHKMHNIYHRTSIVCVLSDMYKRQLKQQDQRSAFITANTHTSSDGSLLLSSGEHWCYSVPLIPLIMSLQHTHPESTVISQSLLPNIETSNALVIYSWDSGWLSGLQLCWHSWFPFCTNHFSLLNTVWF